VAGKTHSARLVSDPQHSPGADGVARYRLPVYLACTLLVLLTNYALGKDIPWDMLNYHLYAGFSAVHDRFAQDYFAAGAQAYFNPYAYAPFYALVSTGLPALALSSILAAVHSVLLWLIFELGVTVAPSSDVRTRLAVGLCAAALAFLDPIVLQQIGSSFADITTGTLVVGGWLLLAHSVREPRVWRTVAAGVLLGVAVALKPTNAVHAVAAFALLIMLPGKASLKLSHALHLGVATVLACAAVAAPWAYRLEHMFGNPVFPLMNNLFRSPEFTTTPLRSYRFIPDSLGAALWRPFAMLAPVRGVHEELRAPEICYALLASLVVVLALRWLWLRLRLDRQPALVAEPAAKRALAALGCGLAVDWVLWLTASGNGRYLLAIGGVAATVVIGLLFRLLARRPRVRNYLLVAIFAVQVIQVSIGAELRWNHRPWRGQWFSVVVPAQLATERNLYLTIGVESNSFIAPDLAPDSGLINVSGWYALPGDGPSGERIQALIRRYAPHVRVLVRGAHLYEDSEGRNPRRSRVDAVLQRFHLRVDAGDCTTITAHGLPPDIEVVATSVPTLEYDSGDTSYLVSCRLVPDTSDHREALAQQRAADIVLDRLEDACPLLFQPRRLLSEPAGNEAWMRRYGNTDLNAWVSHGWVKFQNVIAGRMQYVGSEADWLRAPLRVVCGRRNGQYFAHVVDAPNAPAQ
jgi:hypothetical protein